MTNTRFRIIAGRPIVGRDYWPQPTLRRLPIGSRLEIERPRKCRRWLLVALAIACAVAIVV